MYTQTTEKDGNFALLDIPIFGSVCIAPLIQVELLRPRFVNPNLWCRLCQTSNFRMHWDINPERQGFVNQHASMVGLRL